ncbi:MAG TPA: hypothetical protein VG841_11435 [Caulobacterales bacterium]|nr:hypothetical protein [Caulobacterales bacterium]
MIVLLWALSLFNVAVGVGALALALRLATAEERAHWQSPRLLRIAEVFAWVLPILALAMTAIAWIEFQAHPAAALLAFVPLGWLLLMGIVFAVVDFAEDGILGNARR